MPCFFSYLPISFYIAIENLDTKTSESIASISVIMSKKVCICRGFAVRGLSIAEIQILFFIHTISLPLLEIVPSVRATTPDRARRPTRFGIAIMPFRVSAISHISLPEPVAPTMQTKANTALKRALTILLSWVR